MDKEAKTVLDDVTDLDDDLPAEPTDDDADIELGDEVPEAGEQLELVLEEDSGSQPPKRASKSSFRRIKKLADQRRAAENQNAIKDQELAAKEEELQATRALLEQAQLNSAAKIPDPLDYDEGVSDPKYQEAHQAYTQALVQSEFRRQAGASAQAGRPAAEDDRELKKKQHAHYERASKLGFSDYEEVEDVAMDILGVENVNQFIRRSKRAHYALYYLGQRPDEAEKLAELFETDPIQGVLEFARLESRIKSSKATPKSTPDPDTELPGGTPSATERYQKQYNSLLDKATKGGPNAGKWMEKARAYHRNVAAKGVSL